MQKLIEVVQDGHKTLNAKVDTVNVNMATTQASVAATQSAVAVMQADIGEMKTNLARVTERLDNHKDGCEDRHEPLSARIDMIESQLKQKPPSDSSANAAVEISKSSAANMTAVVVAIISLLGTATMALSQFLK